MQFETTPCEWNKHVLLFTQVTSLSNFDAKIELAFRIQKKIFYDIHLGRHLSSHLIQLFISVKKKLNFIYLKPWHTHKSRYHGFVVQNVLNTLVDTLNNNNEFGRALGHRKLPAFVLWTRNRWQLTQAQTKMADFWQTEAFLLLPSYSMHVAFNMQHVYISTIETC